MIRRNMYTPMSSAMVGSSPMYETFVYSELLKDKKVVRYGINSELGRNFEVEEFKEIPIPGDKKGKINPTKISKEQYTSWTTKFPGAYVKVPRAGIINDGSLIIDLDASLPPDEKIFIKRDNRTYWNSIGDYNFVENDETLTWNNKNESCWKKVLGKIEHQWNGDLVTIKTETGKTVTVTSNHSIFGVKQKTKTFKPELIDAGKLQKGDFVVGLKQFETVGLEKIVEISTKHYEGPVYDISVEETERFFAGTGIGAHNTSLYPSKILESNISFDSYRARILPPTTYTIINLLENTLGKTVLPKELPQKVFELVDKYMK